MKKIKYMKKIIALGLIMSIISTIYCFNTFAHELNESDYINNTTEEKAIDVVENFITEAYSEYYTVSDFNSQIDSKSVQDDMLEVVVKSNFNKILKARSTDELPYIQGMQTSVNELIRLRSNESTIGKYILNNQVSMLNEYIDKKQEENAIFKVSYRLDDVSLENPNLEVFGVDEFISAQYFIPETSEKLYTKGKNELKENIDTTIAELQTANPDLNTEDILNLNIPKAMAIKYDRIAARNYANKYTSECGNSYNTKYWNPNYVWHTESGGVDCANYVSQAIHAGGIPTNNTWKPESTAWINTGRNNVNGLTHYMVNAGYFTKVTRNTCAAGGFISHTDFSHVIFVVANDTVTMQFSSHTADRLKASFAGNYYKNFDYYFINSAYL